MQELIKDLPAKLKDNASWLINAGADDTTRRLADMTGTEDDMRVLRAAIATEEAGAKRSSRLKPMQSKLNKFSETARNALIASKGNTLGEALKSKVITSVNEGVASICEAPSLLKAIAQIKNLSANKDGYADAQLREIFQAALTREVRSKPQRRAIIQAIKNALKKLPEETPETPPSKRAKAITTEVITPKDGVLLDASKALQKLRKVVVAHEEKFAAATLGPRLQIGLQCLKAYQVFVIKDPKKTGAMKGKKAVTRDGLSEGGFEGWLATECQWLKKPTAYKYMTAVRGLALDHDATEKQVAAALKLKLRKGPVTIKALCDLAVDPFAPGGDESDNDPQSEFEFLKKACGSLREEVEALVAIKAQLDAHPDFKRAAEARLYGALYELTGTHWQPSDQPNSLADIDPDAIKI